MTTTKDWEQNNKEDFFTQRPSSISLFLSVIIATTNSNATEPENYLNI